MTSSGKPKFIIATNTVDFEEFVVRLIEALEIERNVAVRADDPDPEALAWIDADVRRLGSWIDWVPPRLRGGLA